jgi:hypothetical protein
MKFYVLRPVVSVSSEVNIFGPHLQIRLVELVPTVMIDDLDKSCAKAEPNFKK